MESKIVPNIFYQSTFDKWPIEDSSVQAIITSPPYYSLRKYDIPDITIGKWKGQYGLEPSYQMYIENTLLWCKEAMRVLKKDGIFFLNLGDTWASKGKTGGDFSPYGKLSKSYSGRCRQNDYPAKSKLLMPHRVAIGLIDNNWILRNDIVWYKPNAMPESCKDRFSKKFEYIFIFSKNENYKFNLDSIRESHSEVSLNRVKHPWKSNHPSIGKIDTAKMGDRFCNPKGKNPGDMWSITTQPSKEEHYAMWPEKLVERMILCSTDEGDIVLDPFCGSGRTVEVSSNMKRVGLGIDLGYEVISKKRNIMSNLRHKYNKERYGKE